MTARVPLGMVCADTTRSRAYLQNMARRGLVPDRILVLASPERQPGAISAPVVATPDRANEDALWQEAAFDPNTPLEQDLDRLGAPRVTVPAHDINAHAVVTAIADMQADTIIYSGYGSQILRPEVLSLGSRFLHVHGGHLPDYPGSTTNYYSLLERNEIGASAIFLEARIDAGPVLLRRAMPAPPDRTKLDHLHDPAIRALVLCDVLQARRTDGDWPRAVPQTKTREPFFVVHPVLKHLAVYPPGHRGAS